MTLADGRTTTPDLHAILVRSGTTDLASWIATLTVEMLRGGSNPHRALVALQDRADTAITKGNEAREAAVSQYNAFIRGTGTPGGLLELGRRFDNDTAANVFAMDLNALFKAYAAQQRQAAVPFFVEDVGESEAKLSAWAEMQSSKLMGTVSGETHPVLKTLFDEANRALFQERQLERQREDDQRKAKQIADFNEDAMLKVYEHVKSWLTPRNDRSLVHIGQELMAKPHSFAVLMKILEPVVKPAFETFRASFSSILPELNTAQSGLESTWVDNQVSEFHRRYGAQVEHWRSAAVVAAQHEANRQHEIARQAALAAEQEARRLRERASATERAAAEKQGRINAFNKKARDAALAKLTEKMRRLTEKMTLARKVRDAHGTGTQDSVIQTMLVDYLKESYDISEPELRDILGNEPFDRAAWAQKIATDMLLVATGNQLCAVSEIQQICADAEDALREKEAKDA